MYVGGFEALGWYSTSWQTAMRPLFARQDRQSGRTMQRPGHKSGTMRPEGQLCTPGSAVYPALASALQMFNRL